MSRKRGNVGELVACNILQDLGFTIIDRNFYTRYGEIDIIAQKGSNIHFIEVKTTYGSYNPIENFHKKKLNRFIKTVKIYCYKNKISDSIIEIDLVLINMEKRTCRIVRNANLYFH